MLKRLIPIIALCSFIFSACNSSSQEEEYQLVASSDASIMAFQLVSNEKVLDSLNNVYFSIDLLNARVFNADSLPYGTPTSRLVALITTKDASGVLITFSREGASDTTVNYLTNSTDSIDFSRGPVKVSVTSQSGTVTRDYMVEVNVHKVKADSLAWQSLESIALPSSFNTVKAQYAAKKGETFYCLTASATGEYCMSTTTDPYSGTWDVNPANFPFAPEVTSLRASSESLYILSSDNHLYSSADGSTWSDTGVAMSYIYGSYLDQVVGTDGSNIVAYPSGKTFVMPAGFPVKGTSLPASYETSMGISEQIVILGGVCADGSLSRSAWGFDGNTWACISRASYSLPEGLESPTLVAYDLFKVSLSTWTPTQYPALVAFGGKKADNSISRTVYISKDWGMTWIVAPELMALPESLPALYCQPAFIYATEMHSRASRWNELAVRPLYPFASFVNNRVSSRATTPITQWDCPAIYLFGGLDAAGNTNPTLWRGLISRYTFKPIQ